MIAAVRKIQFCAGHRVYKHESKCANLHGHNYIAFFHAVADDLDAVGRVIDFSVLKEKIGGWIEEKWDHTFIINVEDEQTCAIFQHIKQPKAPYMMSNNPTAENMADHLLRDVCPKVLAGTGVKVMKVVLWETENCFVEATFEGVKNGNEYK